MKSLNVRELIEMLSKMPAENPVGIVIDGGDVVYHGAALRVSLYADGTVVIEGTH